MRMLTAALVGVLGTGIGVMAAPPVQAPTSSVAFINVGRVMQEVPGGARLQGGLKAELDGLKDSIKARADEIREREKDVEARFAPNTPEYDRERKALAMAAQELEWDERAGRESLKKKQVRGMADLYRTVCAEASRIAEEMGYTAVLQAEIEPIPIEDENGNLINYTDLRLQMAMRTVIWNSKGVDITDDVIKALKEE